LQELGNASPGSRYFGTKASFVDLFVLPGAASPVSGLLFSTRTHNV